MELSLLFNSEMVTINKLRASKDMHKMHPRRPEHYIFVDHFYLKNATKLRFNVFVHFNAKSHI